MSAKVITFIKVAAGFAAALSFGAPMAGAADLGLMLPAGQVSSGCSEIVLTCENGREYPICPISVSVAGELVTARLYTSPHQVAYVRLVPMGVGYRYAGKGIWLDGLRGSAQLNFGNNRSIACSVSQS